MLVWWWFGALALADIVPDLPANCPAGSVGTTNHTGAYCTPDECEVDACGTGQACESTGLCVIREERPCGGLQDPNQPCTFSYVEAVSPCETQADCSNGAQCENEPVCIAPRACGCSSSMGFPAVMFLVGLLPFAWRRRS